MIYRVTKQYGKGADTLATQFDNINDAKKFIQEKLIEDARYKLKVTYRLWEGMDLLQEFAEVQVTENASDSGDTGAGSGTASKQSSFQPTPFNMAPRPSGTPHSWIKDDDDQEEDGKK